MPGQFVQSYWTVQSSLEVAGSGNGVHESDVALMQCAQGWVFSDVFAGDLGAAVGWSGPEGFALLAKVAKFVGTSWFPTIPCY